MESDLFQSCIVRCRKCFTEIRHIEDIKSHSCVPGDMFQRAREITLEQVLQVMGVNLLPTPVVETPQVVKKPRSKPSLIKKKPLPLRMEINDDEKIDQALDKINSKRNSFFEESVETIERRLHESDDWQKIREDRTRLLRHYTGRQWEVMVKDHWARYKSSADFSKEKVVDYFSTIEQRVIDELRYCRPIDPDDVNMHVVGLSIASPDMRVFVMDDFIENFISIKLLLKPAESVVKDFFQKSPECIGYLPMKGVDSYAFFLLHQNGEDLYWKYDCRLEILGESLFSEIVRYLTHYFRKIYAHLFGDNVYHSQLFSSITAAHDTELRQIISSLIWCESAVKFTKNLQEIARKYCQVQDHPVKFPKFTDTKEKQKKFKADLKISTPKKVVAELFDSIEETNIEELINQFTRN